MPNIIEIASDPNFDPRSASKIGSDSHSMMFACGLVLFQENQHHAIQLSDFVLDSERICRR